MPSEPAPVVVLRPPGREPYAVTLDRLTALVRAARVLRMGRLADALRPAADARDGLEREVIEDVSKYVQRVDEVRRRKDDIFMKQHRALDVDVSDLAEMEADLEAFGKNDKAGASDGNAYAGTTPPKP
jgi:hypothetical protein